MWNTQLATAFDDMFNGADKYLVGYDRVFDRLAEVHERLNQKSTNYPPYNIIKSGENGFIIEMAVAGFSEKDIDVEVEDDILTVSSNGETDHSSKNVVYRGLALRQFKRTFTLGDHIEVKEAAIVNGLLQIYLERIIPEHKKPRKISIAGSLSSPIDSDDRQYLTEESGE